MDRKYYHHHHHHYLLVLIAAGFAELLYAIDNPLKAQTIIRQYSDNRNQFKSYIIKEEMETTFKAKMSDPHYTPYNGTWKQYYENELKTDGNRYSAQNLRWGNDQRSGNFIPKEKGMFNSSLFDGEKLYGYSFGSKVRKRRAHHLSGKNLEFRQETLCRGLTGYAAFGYFEGDLNTRIDELLKNATVRISDKIETVNGFACCVLMAETTNGDYKLWFAPEQGYTIVKAIKRARAGDIHNGSPLPENSFCNSTFEVQKMEKIDGAWIPKEVHFKGKIIYPNGDFSQNESIYKITSVQINPNHDASGSFAIDTLKIRHGARAFIGNSTNIEYIWQNGKLIPKSENAATD